MKKMILYMLFLFSIVANGEDRVWTDKSGKTLIASLQLFALDGMVTLKHGNKQFSVKYDSLCQEDRDHLDLLSDPYGKNAQRISERKHKEENERREKELEKLNASKLIMKRKTFLTIIRTFSDKPIGGQIRKFSGSVFWIKQIIDEDSAIILYRTAEDITDKKTAFLKGIKTDGLFDGIDVNEESFFICDGTISLQTPDGRKTFPSIRPLNLEEVKKGAEQINSTQKEIDLCNKQMIEILSGLSGAEEIIRMLQEEKRYTIDNIN